MQVVVVLREGASELERLLARYGDNKQSNQANTVQSRLDFKTVSDKRTFDGGRKPKAEPPVLLSQPLTGVNFLVSLL